MRLQTAGQPLIIVCADEDVFLRLFTPGRPFNPNNVTPPFPEGDISFMSAIPPIGNKFQPPERLGPSGARNRYYGRNREPAKSITLYFDFSGK